MAKNNLVIVESPAKAKTIGKYLGSGFEVKASMGHIRDLPKSKLGVDVATFEPDYENIKDKAEVIRELRKAAKASDMVYLATDPDREGEAISWHLQSVLGVPREKTCRVTFNEITHKVVTSTPSLLLGRSRMCPMDALTSKPGPRYFPMVFALAGDSTITKLLFAIVLPYSIFSFTAARNRLPLSSDT